MRTLVIGCGSIGSRRARLLAEMGHETTLVDSDPWRDLSGGFRSVDAAFGYADTVGRPFDAAFICTPAHTHLAVAHEVIEAGCKALFIEKPLSTSMDGVAELVEECERRGVVTMGACNMRWAYRDLPIGLQWLDLECSKPLSEWRAGAAEAYMGNGIVLEAAIHELDLLARHLGPIRTLNAEGDDERRVFIDTHHDSGGRGTVTVDWQPAARRVRQAIAMSWDFKGFCHQPDMSDEMYRKEMAQFLRAASGEEPTTNPLRQAAETLRWALHARDLTRGVAA